MALWNLQVQKKSIKRKKLRYEVADEDFGFPSYIFIGS